MEKQAKVLVFVGILAALGGCANETPEAAAVAPSLDVVSEGAAGQDAPALEGEVADDSSDPFAGDMPDFMVDAMMARLDGELIELSLQRQLFDHAEANPKDARPWLLLADDSLAREFYGAAARQYASALAADSGVHTMFGLVFKLHQIIGSGDEDASETATDLVVAYWGEDALPPAAAGESL